VHPIQALGANRSNRCDTGLGVGGALSVASGLKRDVQNSAGTSVSEAFSTHPKGEGLHSGDSLITIGAATEAGRSADRIEAQAYVVCVLTLHGWWPGGGV
jgi:hypothetical protein